eukprot:NP_509622.1 Probable ribosomal protein F34H10.1 [Caenorhabditis elegans]
MPPATNNSREEKEEETTDVCSANAEKSTKILNCAETHFTLQRRLHFCQLGNSDCGIKAAATIYVNCELLGGAKKRKKKVYTIPKKNNISQRKSSSPSPKYFKIDENGKISRLPTGILTASIQREAFMTQPTTLRKMSQHPCR